MVETVQLCVRTLGSKQQKGPRYEVTYYTYLASIFLLLSSYVAHNEIRSQNILIQKCSSGIQTTVMSITEYLEKIYTVKIPCEAYRGITMKLISRYTVCYWYAHTHTQSIFIFCNSMQ